MNARTEERFRSRNRAVHCCDCSHLASVLGHPQSRQSTTFYNLVSSVFQALPQDSQPWYVTPPPPHPQFAMAVLSFLLHLMWTMLTPSFQAWAKLCTSSQATCQTSLFDRRVLIGQLPLVPVYILHPFPSPLGYSWLCWWGLQPLQGWGGPFPPSFQLPCTLARACVLQGGSPHQVFEQEEELAFNWEAWAATSCGRVQRNWSKGFPHLRH